MVAISRDKVNLVDRILDSGKKEEIVPENRTVAYFSMEVGLKASIPTYSGGLGILAGDTLKSNADLEKHMVAVTLIHRQGYFQQQIGQNGWQNEEYPAWDPAEHMKKLDTTVEIELAGRKVKVQAWMYNQEGQTGESVPVIFLDTNVPENDAEAKKYTQHLYGRNMDYRLSQQAILGIAGMKMLKALGYDNIQKYHMNEGHSSLLAAYLMKELGDEDKVKERCVFTTHTPVGAGHETFDRDLVHKILGHEMAEYALRGSGTKDLNMSLLALNLSGYKNAVARRHGEIAREQFPEHNIDSITNGVHSLTWTSYHMQQLLDKRLPGWSLRPEKVLPRVVNLGDYEVIEAHNNTKKELTRHINRRFPQINLNPEIMTVGWARRFAGYKRADLLFHDIERLAEIAKEGPVQFLIAGKAHPQDEESKGTLHEVFKHIMKLSGDAKIAFIPNYNMEIGALLTSGCDVWLNTPSPPWEASGTSGMKVLHNGGINLSVLDGWWCEGHKEGITGFSVGEYRDVALGNHRDYLKEDDIDAESIYSKLEKILIPMFYNKKREWAKLMKNSIALAAHFNTTRMVKEYWEKAYKLS